MLQVGAEVILSVKCVSCLVYYRIGRSLEGFGFVLGQWELRFAKMPTDSLSPYWLWKILLHVHTEHPQTAICNGHTSFPVSHQHQHE